jgi:hypothetical protein
MILYHFAEKIHLTSILVQGLRINTGHKGLGNVRYYIERYGMQPIFLTDDPQYIVDTMDIHVHSHCILLKVNCSGLDIEPEYDWNTVYLHPKFYPNGKQKTFICRDDISSDRIQIC